MCTSFFHERLLTFKGLDQDVVQADWLVSVRRLVINIIIVRSLLVLVLDASSFGSSTLHLLSNIVSEIIVQLVLAVSSLFVLLQVFAIANVVALIVGQEVVLIDIRPLDHLQEILSGTRLGLALGGSSLPRLARTARPRALTFIHRLPLGPRLELLLVLLLACLDLLLPLFLKLLFVFLRYMFLDFGFVGAVELVLLVVEVDGSRRFLGLLGSLSAFSFLQLVRVLRGAAHVSGLDMLVFVHQGKRGKVVAALQGVSLLGYVGKVQGLVVRIGFVEALEGIRLAEVSAEVGWRHLQLPIDPFEHLVSVFAFRLLPEDLGSSPGLLLLFLHLRVACFLHSVAHFPLHFIVLGHFSSQIFIE